MAAPASASAFVGSSLSRSAGSFDSPARSASAVCLVCAYRSELRRRRWPGPLRPRWANCCIERSIVTCWGKLPRERIQLIMPQLRQLVIAAEDPERLATFYQQVFDLERIDETHGALFMSDGIFNLALIPEPDPGKRGFR